MSFLIFKKTRTAANIIKMLKTASKASIENLNLDYVLFSAVPWGHTCSVISLANRHSICTNVMLSLSS
jgi:hypothetical protein